MGSTRGSQTLGKHGEKAAAAFLQERGYQILERNFAPILHGAGRCAGEIDIIAEKEGMLSFIEVKTRTPHSGYGETPEDKVSRAKLSKLVRASRIWLRRNGYTGKRWQIDVVTVQLPQGSGKARLSLLTDVAEG